MVTSSPVAARPIAARKALCATIRRVLRESLRGVVSASGAATVKSNLNRKLSTGWRWKRRYSTRAASRTPRGEGGQRI